MEDGCCTHKPALSRLHYDRQGMPKPEVRDDRDEDGDEIIEPTPLVPVDPTCGMQELGGEG